MIIAVNVYVPATLTMNLTVFELIVAESKITLCELTFHWYDKLLSGIDDLKFWTESEYFSLVLAIISFPLLGNVE